MHNKNNDLKEHDIYYEQINLYLDNNLEPQKTKELAKHLNNCEICQEDFLEIAKLKKLVKNSEQDLPDDFEISWKNKIKSNIRKLAKSNNLKKIKKVIILCAPMVASMFLVISIQGKKNAKINKNKVNLNISKTQEVQPQNNAIITEIIQPKIIEEKNKQEANSPKQEEVAKNLNLTLSDEIENQHEVYFVKLKNNSKTSKTIELSKSNLQKAIDYYQSENYSVKISKAEEAKDFFSFEKNTVVLEITKNNKKTKIKNTK